MNTPRRHARRLRRLALNGSAVLCLFSAAAFGQDAPSAAAPVPTRAKSEAKTAVTAPAAVPTGALPPAAGVLVDQVIAVVNGEPILESDVREEQRFQAFQPFNDEQTSDSREATVERLIDRALILQQASLQQEQGVTAADAETQLQTVRKEIPACKLYHCETEAGWAKFVAAQGFTMPELIARWQQRMEILNYVEVRFRNGILIKPEQISAYYKDTLLPQYARQKAPAPSLATLSKRIQEVLLQQQVSSLLEDWLKSLKAEGTVRVIKPGEVDG